MLISRVASLLEKLEVVHDCRDGERLMMRSKIFSGVPLNVFPPLHCCLCRLDSIQRVPFKLHQHFYVQLHDEQNMRCLEHFKYQMYSKESL